MARHGLSWGELLLLDLDRLRLVGRSHGSIDRVLLNVVRKILTDFGLSHAQVYILLLLVVLGRRDGSGLRVHHNRLRHLPVHGSAHLLAGVLLVLTWWLLVATEVLLRLAASVALTLGLEIIVSVKLLLRAIVVVMLLVTLIATTLVSRVAISLAVVVASTIGWLVIATTVTTVLIVPVLVVTLVSRGAHRVVSLIATTTLVAISFVSLVISTGVLGVLLIIPSAESLLLLPLVAASPVVSLTAGVVVALGSSLSDFELTFLLLSFAAVPSLVAIAVIVSFHIQTELWLNFLDFV